MLTKQAYLEITIVDGKLQIEGHGFEGQGCAELAALFASMGDVTEFKRKPDFFKGAANGQVLTVKGK